MTWTWSAEAMDDELMQVRALIGDTDTNDQQLDDEVINFFIASEGNVYQAGAAACRALAAKYARQVDKEVGDLKIAASVRRRSYQEMAKTLAVRGMSSAIPTAGGLSQAEKDAAESNEDLVKTAITLGVHDNT